MLFEKSHRVAVVMAHPDDAEITCLGTLLRFKANGSEVKIFVVCDGRNGISIVDKLAQGVEELNPDIRADESTSALADSGIELEILNHNDGDLRLDRYFISAIERQLLEFAPTILITHYHHTDAADHQDHLVTSEALLNIVRRCPSIVLVMHPEPLVSAMIGWKPNFYVDVTPYFATKLKALRCHDSQKGRFYLCEKWHHMRARMNAIAALPARFDEDLHFESFVLGRMIS